MKNAFIPGQGVPGSLNAGDAWSWRADGFASVYPSPEYALAYHLTPQSGGAPIVAPAFFSADGYMVTVAPAVTAEASPGAWVWALRVTRSMDGAAVTVATGAVTIHPNPAHGGDRRTAARKLLDAVESVLAGRITKDVESYSIEGRALTRIPFLELRAMRAKLLREVAAEEGRGGAAGMRHRKTRIGYGR